MQIFHRILKQRHTLHKTGVTVTKQMFLWMCDGLCIYGSIHRQAVSQNRLKYVNKKKWSLGNSHTLSRWFSLCAAAAFSLLPHSLHMTLMILLNEATAALILSVCLFTPHLMIAEYELFRGSFVFIIMFFSCHHFEVMFGLRMSYKGPEFEKHPLRGIGNLFFICRDSSLLLKNIYFKLDDFSKLINDV